ncbi:MAG TPA: hypothetical protein VI248_06700 [Kineosporiaceae bacterium]
MATPSVTPQPASSQPASSSGGPSYWWLVLLVAILGAGVVTVFVTAGRRHSALHAWDTALAEATRSARWIEERLLPALFGASGPDPGPDTLAPGWSSVRPRILVLEQQLTTLVQTAPDAARRGAADSLRATLGELSASLDAAAAAGTTGDYTLARVRVDLARDRLARQLTQASAATSPGSADGRSQGAIHP